MVAATDQTTQQAPIVDWRKASDRVRREACRYRSIRPKRVTILPGITRRRYGVETNIYPFTARSERDPSVTYQGAVSVDGPSWCECQSGRPKAHCCKHIITVIDELEAAS